MLLERVMISRLNKLFKFTLDGNKTNIEIKHLAQNALFISHCATDCVLCFSYVIQMNSNDKIKVYLYVCYYLLY